MGVAAEISALKSDIGPQIEAWAAACQIYSQIHREWLK
jgi:hypothetical protein